MAELPPNPLYLQASDACAIRNRKYTAQKRILDALVHCMQKRIKVAALHGMSDIDWCVPQMVNECIWTDPKPVIQGLVLHLERQGFFVKVLSRCPPRLYISWRYCSEMDRL